MGLETRCGTPIAIARIARESPDRMQGGGWLSSMWHQTARRRSLGLERVTLRFVDGHNRHRSNFFRRSNLQRPQGLASDPELLLELSAIVSHGVQFPDLVTPLLTPHPALPDVLLPTHSSALRSRVLGSTGSATRVPCESRRNPNAASRRTPQRFLPTSHERVWVASMGILYEFWQTITLCTLTGERKLAAHVRLSRPARRSPPLHVRLLPHAVIRSGARPGSRPMAVSAKSPQMA